MQALHARLQPLLYFFVDGASLIDATEPEWTLLLATQNIGGTEIVVSSCLCCCAAVMPCQSLIPTDFIQSCSVRYSHMQALAVTL